MASIDDIIAKVSETVAANVVKKVTQGTELANVISSIVKGEVSSSADAIAQAIKDAGLELTPIKAETPSTETPSTGTPSTGGNTETPATGTITKGTTLSTVIGNDYTNADWNNGVLKSNPKVISVPYDANIVKDQTWLTLESQQTLNVVGVQVVEAGGKKNMSVTVDQDVNPAYVAGKKLLVRARYDRTGTVSGGTDSGTKAPATGEETKTEVETPVVTQPSQPSTGGSTSGAIPAFGVNMAGLGNNPFVVNWQVGTHFRKPEEKHVQKYAKLGCKLVRLPLAPERLLTGSGSSGDNVGTLNATYLALVTEAMDLFAKYGIKVIPEFHTYYRLWSEVSASKGNFYARQDNYTNGKLMQWIPVGVDGCILTAKGYSALITKFVKVYANHPAYLGFGIANEPHNRGEKTSAGKDVDVHALWIANANAHVQAVYAGAPNGYIFVCGNGYATAKSWVSVSDGLRNIVDPNGKLIYEAHHYLDGNMGGGGAWGNQQENIPSGNGVAMVQPFVEWCRKYNKKGYIGEHGFPQNNSSAALATNNMFDYLEKFKVPSTQWCAGPGAPDGDPLFFDTEGMAYKNNLDPIAKRFGKSFDVWGPVA